MAFTDTFKKNSLIKETENGGRAFSSTNGGALLDLFSTIGGKRRASAEEIEKMWLAARVEDKELADNLILYVRNIRDGGCGERRIGRILLKSLAEIDPCKVARNFQTIVDCGRWDDLYIFENTPVEKDMWNFIEQQLRSDVYNMKNNRPISLMAKWLKSINTSSAESRRLANKTITRLGITPRTYRKTLSKLRQYLSVVEKKMSANEWGDIDFSVVPAKAMTKYQQAFHNHEGERFFAYLKDVKSGEKKINAGTLYPYDIIQKIIKDALHYSYLYNKGSCLICDNKPSEVDELQWAALPNYINEEFDVIVMADVSGSMTVNDYQPLATSIGLATYFAQRNKGAYKGLFMTFSGKPTFIDIGTNSSLDEAFQKVFTAPIGFNTNLDAAFEAIYETSIKSSESPKALIVISDMEIDHWYDGTYTSSISQKWKTKFEEAGLTMPKLILWNVESRSNTTLSTFDENVAYVSGSGIGPFKNLCSLIEKDAYTAMKEILTQSAFSWK